MNLPSLSTAGARVGKVDTSKLTMFGAPIMAILVSLVVSFFVVFPKFTQAFSLRASNSELAVRDQNLVEKAEVLGSLDISELEKQLALSEQVLPSDKASFAFVRQIEVAAASSGVFLDKIDVIPGTLRGQDAVDPTQAAPSEVVPAAAPSLQVKVLTTSNYASLLNFLMTVFSVSRVVSVSELSISSEAESAGVNALKSSFVIEAHWKPLPAELGSVESPVTLLSAEQLEVLARASQSETGGAPSPVVPQVETGREDLFNPF